MALRKQVPVTGHHAKFAAAGDGPHHLARLQRENLVSVAVEHEQRSSLQSPGNLAPGGLRGERDDTTDHHGKPDGDTDRDGATETVAHQDDPLASGAHHHLHGRRRVDAARIHVVRLPVTEPHRRDPAGRKILTQDVVQSLARAHHAAHGTTHHDDAHIARVSGGFVPQDAEKAPARVHLDVTQVRTEHRLLAGHDPEDVERRLELALPAPSVSHVATLMTSD